MVVRVSSWHQINIPHGAEKRLLAVHLVQFKLTMRHLNGEMLQMLCSNTLRQHQVNGNQEIMFRSSPTLCAVVLMAVFLVDKTMSTVAHSLKPLA